MLDTYRQYIGQNESLSNPHGLLTSIMKLKPGTVDLQSLDYRIVNANRDGDVDEFANLWPMLTKKQRETYEPLYERLNILKATNSTYTDIKKWSENNVAQVNSLNTLDIRNHPSGVEIATKVAQRFQHEFNKLNIEDYKGKGPSWEQRMVDDAKSAALVDLYANNGDGQGLFATIPAREGDPGGTMKKYIYILILLILHLTKVLTKTLFVGYPYKNNYLIFLCLIKILVI